MQAVMICLSESLLNSSKVHIQTRLYPFDAA